MNNPNLPTPENPDREEGNGSPDSPDESIRYELLDAELLVQLKLELSIIESASAARMKELIEIRRRKEIGEEEYRISRDSLYMVESEKAQEIRQLEDRIYGTKKQGFAKRLLNRLLNKKKQ